MSSLGPYLAGFQILNFAQSLTKKCDFNTKLSIRFGTKSTRVRLVPEHVLLAIIFSKITLIFTNLLNLLFFEKITIFTRFTLICLKIPCF